MISNYMQKAFQQWVATLLESDMSNENKVERICIAFNFLSNLQGVSPHDYTK
jgi:hypothetical protein